MNSPLISFENDNLRAYTLLMRIEIALRELLKNSLESEFADQWRKRLPGDLLKKIKESQKEENRPQFGYLCLGPLYYLSFGELLTLLQQKSGREVVKKLGGDCVLKQIETICIPRNAVCHSRHVSVVGLKTIETVYAQIETALTSFEFARLLSKPDTGLSQIDAASEMIPELNNVLRDIPKLPSEFIISEVFKTAIDQFWWADDLLAGFNRLKVEDAIILIRGYNALSTGVGSAGTRQRFSEETSLKKVVQDAVSQLEKMIL